MRFGPFLVIAIVMIGSIAEICGVHDALMTSMIISLVIVCIGITIIMFDVGGLVSGLLGIAFATIFAFGVTAATSHDEQDAAKTVKSRGTVKVARNGSAAR